MLVGNGIEGPSELCHDVPFSAVGKTKKCCFDDVMAEPLKNLFGLEIARGIGEEIRRVHPGFDVPLFCREVGKGYGPLNLMARGRQIAQALRRHLPEDYVKALGILLASLGPRPTGGSMAVFFYMPHTQFVSEFGLDHLEESLEAQYQLTQRFTAEFSIRPFLVRYPRETLKRLHLWAVDPDVHVRRLVSEGTRPRLPWGMRLKAFQEDPAPVLPLLELLKDDPEMYVRRSVANHLNDIGKDHPELLAGMAERWLKRPTPERRWVVRHALRSAVKRGEPGALRVLGCHRPVSVKIDAVCLSPCRPVIGGKVRIRFHARNTGRTSQRIMADLRVHFVKASGKTSPKVFKLKLVELAKGEVAELGKTISLAVQSTRKPHAGLHRVEVLLNGRPHDLGKFHLRKNPERSSGD
jgi:3-methyladenine DNA glycosylase AlkC